MKFFLRTKKYYLLLFIFIASYIIYFTTLSFLRYDNFYAGRFDLGNMDQTVWNTVHGRVFQSSGSNGVVSRLSSHADFILILLAPFYILWEDPRMLLLLQTVVVSLGALFVFLLAKKIINNNGISLILSFSYLLNPSIERANLYDFHAVTFATTFFLSAFYFLVKKRYALFLLFAILAGLTKEQVWLTVSFLGIYVVLSSKKKIFGGSLFFLSVIIFYLLIWSIIPTVRGANHFAIEYYSDFGSSPTEIVKSIFFSPLKTLEILTQQSRLNYLLQLNLPLGFLPVVFPFPLIFVIQDFLINLLSKNAQLHQIFFQYTATISPFLFISSVYAIKFLRQILPKIPLKLYSFYILLFALLGAFLYGPLPFAKYPDLDTITKPQKNKEVIYNFLHSVPQNYSVTSTNNLGGHLSHREKIFTIPEMVDKTDIIAFLLGDPFAQPSPAKQKEMVKNLKKDKRYKIILEKDELIVFQKINP